MQTSKKSDEMGILKDLSYQIMPAEHLNAKNGCPVFYQNKHHKTKICDSESWSKQHWQAFEHFNWNHFLGCSNLDFEALTTAET